MLIELLAQSNFCSYNVPLAHILGLHSAIYLSNLININNKAIQKNKLTENFFILDRDYITQQTTFSVEEQKEIEKALLKIGILEKAKDNDNMLSLNITVLTSIMMSPNESLIDNIKRLTKVNSQRERGTKKDAICNNLKSFIVCENAELREAYEGWIEGVYANPNGFLSKRSITIFQRTIDEFCNHNLDLALKIIDIAAVNGYRDATWAINVYKKEYMPKYADWSQAQAPVSPPISLGNEVF